MLHTFSLDFEKEREPLEERVCPEHHFVFGFPDRLKALRNEGIENLFAVLAQAADLLSADEAELGLSAVALTFQSCKGKSCSILITADETLFIISCREQDNGNMADRNIFFDVYAQLVSVHPRHHHIADNDIRNVTFDKLESLQNWDVKCPSHSVILPIRWS